MNAQIIKAGAAAAALISILTLWFQWIEPRYALSGDLKRLDKNQADTAVDIYSRQLRGYLAVEPPKDFTARAYWNEEVESIRKRLKEAEDRKIELSR